MPWEFIEPYPGSHIRVQVGKIYHHAIYIGDNMVIQFGMPFSYTSDPKSIKVIKSPIEDFLSNGFLEVRVYTKKEQHQKRSDDQIIKIATSRIGEGGYDLLYNNCEHFVNDCIFGKKISEQVELIHQDIRKKLGIKK